MLFFTSTSTHARKYAAIMLAMLFVAAQFSAGFHLVVVEHVTCEHGKTVHGQHLVQGQHLRANEATQAHAWLNSRVSQEQNAPDGPENHDHCSVSVLENTAFEVQAGIVVEHVALALAQVEPAVALKQVWCSTYPQYKLAPKQSPPFAAI